MKIDKQTLGLAAEFAVASELCRRDVYAQPTLGRRKRTDLLAETEEGMLRIQVKAKRGATFPLLKGVYGDEFLILVDYRKKGLLERPDFYILTSEDWRRTLETMLAERIFSGEVVIDEKNVPIWQKRVDMSKPLVRGHSVKTDWFTEFRERWDKITDRARAQVKP